MGITQDQCCTWADLCVLVAGAARSDLGGPGSMARQWPVIDCGYVLVWCIGPDTGGWCSRLGLACTACRQGAGMADVQQFYRVRWRLVMWWVVLPLALVLGTVVALVVGGRLLVRSVGDPNAYHVGSCFRLGKAAGVLPPVGGLREVTGRAIPVDCATPHDAKITRAVGNASACADEGAWLISLDQTYCVVLLNGAG